MEQKFKMQIQRLAKQAAAVLTAVTVGILSAAAVFSQNSNPVYASRKRHLSCRCQSKLS